MPLYQGRQVLISETALSGLATATILVPAGYKHLRFETHVRMGSTAGGNIQIQLGTAGSIDATAANYDRQIWLNGTVSTSVQSANTIPELGTPPISTATANYYGSGKYEIFNPSYPVNKNIYGYYVNPVVPQWAMIRGLWRNTGVVDRIKILPSIADTFAANSFVRLYGER